MANSPVVCDKPRMTVIEECCRSGSGRLAWRIRREGDNYGLKLGPWKNKTGSRKLATDRISFNRIGLHQWLSISYRLRRRCILCFLNSIGLYKSIADKALATKTCMIMEESGYRHNLLAIDKSRGPIEKIEYIR